MDNLNKIFTPILVRHFSHYLIRCPVHIRKFRKGDFLNVGHLIEGEQVFQIFSAYCLFTVLVFKDCPYSLGQVISVVDIHPHWLIPPALLNVNVRVFCFFRFHNYQYLYFQSLQTRFLRLVGLFFNLHMDNLTHFGAGTQYLQSRHLASLVYSIVAIIIPPLIF